MKTTTKKTTLTASDNQINSNKISGTLNNLRVSKTGVIYLINEKKR